MDKKDIDYEQMGKNFIREKAEYLLIMKSIFSGSVDYPFRYYEFSGLNFWKDTQYPFQKIQKISEKVLSGQTIRSVLLYCSSEVRENFNYFLRLILLSGYISSLKDNNQNMYSKCAEYIGNIQKQYRIKTNDDEKLDGRDQSKFRDFYVAEINHLNRSLQTEINKYTEIYIKQSLTKIKNDSKDQHKIIMDFLDKNKVFLLTAFKTVSIDPRMIPNFLDSKKIEIKHKNIYSSDKEYIMIAGERVERSRLPKKQKRMSQKGGFLCQLSKELSLSIHIPTDSLDDKSQVPINIKLFSFRDGQSHEKDYVVNVYNMSMSEIFNSTLRENSTKSHSKRNNDLTRSITIRMPSKNNPEVRTLPELKKGIKISDDKLNKAFKNFFDSLNNNKSKSCKTLVPQKQKIQKSYTQYTLREFSVHIIDAFVHIDLAGAIESLLLIFQYIPTLQDIGVVGTAFLQFLELIASYLDDVGDLKNNIIEILKKNSDRIRIDELELFQELRKSSNKDRTEHILRFMLLAISSATSSLVLSSSSSAVTNNVMFTIISCAAWFLSIYQNRKIEATCETIIKLHERIKGMRLSVFAIKSGLLQAAYNENKDHKSEQKSPNSRLVNNNHAEMIKATHYKRVSRCNRITMMSKKLLSQLYSLMRYFSQSTVCCVKGCIASCAAASGVYQTISISSPTVISNNSNSPLTSSEFSEGETHSQPPLSNLTI